MAEPDEASDQLKRGGAAAAGRIPAPVRHRRILDAFNRQGFVSVADIAQEIGVSTLTIRRDLVVLERDGMITRTHGGAMAIEAEREAEEPLFDQRVAQNAGAKQAMALAAAGLVGARESVGLDVGTTVLALAQELAGRTDLRIFTNNLRAAMRLAGTGSPVYLLGGEVRVPEFSVVGSAAVQHVRNHFLDRVFIGVSAIDANGLYDFSPEDTEVKRALIENSGCVVVLCDASKFERRALARITGLDAVDILVTDRAPPASLAQALEAEHVRVIVADADRTGSNGRAT